VYAESIKQFRECPEANRGAEMLWEAILADQGGLLEPSGGQHVEVLGKYTVNEDVV